MTKVISLISLFFNPLTACNKKSTEDQVAKWTSNHVVHITTLEAGTGSEDLFPLNEILEDANIISLGEANHGYREVVLFRAN